MPHHARQEYRSELDRSCCAAEVVRNVPQPDSRGCLGMQISISAAFAGVDAIVLFGNGLNRLPPRGHVRLELDEDSCRPAEV